MTESWMAARRYQKEYENRYDRAVQKGIRGSGFERGSL